MAYNKKGQFLARDWVVSAILFAGMIALLVLMAGGMVDTYDAQNVTDEEFSDTFDNLDENTQIAQDMWNKSAGEGGLSTIGTFDLLFKATFSIIDLVFSSVTLAGNQVFGFTEYFGVPSEVSFLFFTILMSVLTVLIVFIVISSVSRREL